MIVFHTISFADCTKTGIGTTNYTSIAWAGGGCTPWPGSPTGDYTGIITMGISNNSTVTMNQALNITGDLIVDIGNNSNLIFAADITISGDFIITCNSCQITINSGFTLDIAGDMGDSDNNNAIYAINGNLIVGGTLSGKNGNDLGGTGSIDVGIFDFDQDPCAAPADCSGLVITADTCDPVLTPTLCALPITLIYFEGFKSNNIVKLVWASATEENFDYYTLERSTDGFKFIELGYIVGRGGFGMNQEYEYTDESPRSGINYYRLKATDLDGSFEYHKIIAINYEGEVKKGISVYPNPTSGMITVRNNENIEEGLIEIIDSSGRVIMSSAFSGYANTLVLPEGINPGIYFVIFSSQNRSFKKNLIVR